ncbi:MAG TPA: nucleotidyltransferase domain-containing protein [Candidatus Nanoarchaeia archaeon]|nr:nucleotidyltransferase domain-containing protein [Candidatus Nanoarchaeia archaeon]
MGLEKPYSLQGLTKSLKKIFEAHKGSVFDIIIFGSLVKGKEDVSDQDVCVIFLKKEDKALDKVGAIPGVHSGYLMLEELYSQPLWKTLLREGYSVKSGKALAEIFGERRYGLYTYDLRGMKRKSRFSQILKGYRSESILARVNGILLKPGVVLVPIERVELFRSFLEVWKAKYSLKYISMQEM